MSNPCDSPETGFELTAAESKALDDVDTCIISLRLSAHAAFRSVFGRACRGTTTEPSSLHEASVLQCMGLYPTSSPSKFGNHEIGQFVLWIRKNEVDGDDDLSHIRGRLLELQGVDFLTLLEELSDALPLECDTLLNDGMSAAGGCTPWLLLGRGDTKYLSLQGEHLTDLTKKSETIIQSMQLCTRGEDEYHRDLQLLQVPEKMIELGDHFKLFRSCVEAGYSERRQGPLAEEISTTGRASSFDLSGSSACPTRTQNGSVSDSKEGGLGSHLSGSLQSVSFGLSSLTLENTSPSEVVGCKSKFLKRLFGTRGKGAK